MSFRADELAKLHFLLDAMVTAPDRALEYSRYLLEGPWHPSFHLRQAVDMLAKEITSAFPPGKPVGPDARARLDAIARQMLRSTTPAIYIAGRSLANAVIACR